MKYKSLFILTFVLVTMLATMVGPVAAQFYGPINVDLVGELHSTLETFENTPEKLTFSVLYASTAEAPEDVCEFDMQFLHEQSYDYSVDTEGCAAYRFVYTFEPSPIPADAEIIATEFDFGKVHLEFVLATDFLPQLKQRQVVSLTPIRSEYAFDLAFFGDNGGRTYDKTRKDLTSILPVMLSTRNHIRLYVDDIFSQGPNFNFTLFTDHEYIHRDFTPADQILNPEFSTEKSYVGGGELFNGVFKSGGGGMTEYTTPEPFEGPINVSGMTFYNQTPALLRSGGPFSLARLILFGTESIRISYTTDETYVQKWEINHYDPTIQFSLTMPEFKDETIENPTYESGAQIPIE